jgi:hypothetical protein
VQKRRRITMKLKHAVLAVLAGSAALAAPAFADNGWHHGRDHWRHSHFAPRVIVSGPVYYSPAPTVYYSPAPVYYSYSQAPVYATPAPVIAAAPVYPAPVYRPAPAISLRFRLPL